MKFTCDKCNADINTDNYSLLKKYKNLRFQSMYSLCEKCTKIMSKWIFNDGN